MPQYTQTTNVISTLETPRSAWTRTHGYSLGVPSLNDLYTTAELLTKYINNELTSDDRHEPTAPIL